MNAQQTNLDAADEMEEHVASVLEMRTAGYTYRQIAAQMGVDVATAHRHVKRQLEQQRQEEEDTRKEMRELDLMKIAWLERRIMGAALGGDLSAARFMLACIQSRRQCYKEGAPGKSRQSIAEITAAVDEWEARNLPGDAANEQAGGRNAT